MTARRIPPGALSAVAAWLALVAAAAAGAAAAGTSNPTDAFEGAVAAIAALLLVVVSLLSRPAWPLSLGLAMAVFSGHWDQMEIPVPVDRLLIFSAVASLLVRQWRAEPRGLRTQPIHWLLVVVAVYALCSALLAGTLNESSPRFNLLDRFSLIAFVLFYLAPFAYREARDRQILMGTFVALGGYLGLTALIETTGPRGIIVPRYIDDPLVGTTSTAPAGRSRRRRQTACCCTPARPSPSSQP